MEKRLDKLESKVDTIMENHLVNIKDDIVELKEEISVISTNVFWLMKFFWIVATASIGSLVTAVMGLIIK